MLAKLSEHTMKTIDNKNTSKHVVRRVWLKSPERGFVLALVNTIQSYITL